MKIALITGINGQDGSYLAESLLAKGYEVHGIIRRASLINTARIDHIIDDIKLHYGDLTDSSSLNRLLAKIEPNEIYNLAAQSHVAVSFSVPEYTLDVNATGVLRLLDAIRETKLEKTRLYQASSSELYGKTTEEKQSEKTPFYPRSPYGAAKLCAYWLVVNYRESYNLFTCNGILFNHESPRRGANFVTKKIAAGIANIMKGKQKYLSVGNLYAKRDWGYSKEYCEAMWLMLQQDKPDDYVIATGESHSVKDFINVAFKYINMPIEWHGVGFDEHAVDKDGNIVIKVDSRYYRPAEVDYLCGDATKAKNVLGWNPKVKFDELIKIMLDYELST